MILAAAAVGLIEGVDLARQGRWRELIAVSLVLLGAILLALLPVFFDNPPYTGPALNDLAKALLKLMGIKPPV
ncbi:MAG: hypothetical protein ACM3XS_05835 [Bacteroidota bacterium]